MRDYSAITLTASFDIHFDKEQICTKFTHQSQLTLADDDKHVVRDVPQQNACVRCTIVQCTPCAFSIGEINWIF